MRTIEEIALEVADKIFTGNCEDDSEINLFAKELLATLQREAEPAGYFIEDDDGFLNEDRDGRRTSGTPLFRQPPLPAEDNTHGFAIRLDREQWGAVIDGLMLERERSDSRKKANEHSNSNVRSEMCAEVIKKIGHSCAIVQSPLPVEQSIPDGRNPLMERCYLLSQPYLSGHRLVIGFETLEQVQEAHSFVAQILAAASQPSAEQPEQVKIPTSEDEAALMVLIGTNWLETNKPDRLKQAGAVPEGWKQDAERLDWLQEHQTIVYRSEREVRIPKTDGSLGYDKAFVFEGWCILGNETIFASLREAVDAAMLAEAPQPPKGE